MLMLVVFRAAFDADHVTHLLHHRCVPRRSHADCLREDGSVAGPRNAMQRLAPGLIIRHAQARDRDGPVLELRCLLVERHAIHQVVRARGGRKRSIHISGWLGLRERNQRDEHHDGENDMLHQDNSCKQIGSVKGPILSNERA